MVWLVPHGTLVVRIVPQGTSVSIPCKWKHVAWIVLHVTSVECTVPNGTGVECVVPHGASVAFLWGLLVQTLFETLYFVNFR